MPFKVVPVAVAFGICAAVAYLAFQTSIKIGKITIGWLMMNLSTVVPAAASIWVYKEKLTPLKIVAFALGLASVLCSFWAQKTEAPETVKLGGEKD
jgi:drug/metabolite transporter (DMT)-like permease